MNRIDKPPSWLDLESVIPLQRSRPKKRSEDKAEEGPHTAEEITGLSADTLKRRHSKRVLHLSERRRGMKLRDALAISNGE